MANQKNGIEQLVSSKLDTIANDLASVKQDVSVLKTDVSALKTDVSALTTDVSGLQGTAKGATWAVGLLLLAVAGGTWYFGESKIREIARAVIREEMEFRNTIVQQGRFIADKKVADDPLTFEWPLQKPVDPSALVSLVAETLTVTPGVAIESILGKAEKRVA